MSDPYSIKVGRGDEFARGRGIQQFTFTKSVQKTNPFSLYIDHGALSDYIEMGMLVNLYHNQERIFKGRVLGFDEDDDGISIAGNDMLVAFPNVFVDLDYDDGETFETLLYDVMHKTSTKRHVDNIDAETFVRPTNLYRQWIINDKPLMTMLNDLVPSSQDPSGFRRNTFFLDPYDNLYVEPIGGGGEFRGAIDLQKRKMGCKVDGSFCNYAVYRGVKAIPEPANRDSWTEDNAAVWMLTTQFCTVTDDTESQKNAAGMKVTLSGSFDVMRPEIGFDDPRDFSGHDFCELFVRMDPASGTIDFNSCAIQFIDDSVNYAYIAAFSDNVDGITSMSSGTWYRLRIPLTEDVGDTSSIVEIRVQLKFSASSASHVAYFDGLFIERTERVATIRDENSIKTFGLFEKRKRDTNLWTTAEVTTAAQALLNPYPKMNYAVTARGYVPMRLNQTIGVRWKEVDWVLPLTQNRMTLKAGVTTSHMTFGGMPLSADDVNNALAAENRAETYGRVVRHNKEVDSGDDPLNHETVTVDDGVSDLRPYRWGLKSWKGKSGVILSPAGNVVSWGDFNQYERIPL